VYDQTADHDLPHPGHSLDQLDGPVSLLFAVSEARQTDQGALTLPIGAMLEGPPARLIAGLRAGSRLPGPYTASKDKADPQSDEQRRNGIAADESGQVFREP
jgi:hypothetical protein